MAALAWYKLRHWTADKLGDCVLGTATGGSATTVVDATRRKEADNYWAGVWVKLYSGTGSGQERMLSASTQSSGTLTHASTSFSAEPVAGTLYELHEQMPAEEYDRFLLQALTTLTRRRKLLAWKYDTSLSWVTNQWDYTVPSGFVGIVNVEIATDSGTPDSDEYKFIPQDQWHIRHDTTRKLVFSQGWGQFTADYKLRLSGYQEFTDPTLDSDTYNLDPAPLTSLAAGLAAQSLAAHDPSGRWGQISDRLLGAAGQEEDKIKLAFDPGVKWVEEL